MGLESEIARRGFAVTRLLDASAVAAARAFFDVMWEGMARVGDLSGGVTEVTGVHAKPEHAAAVDGWLRRELGPAAAAPLAGHRAFFATFYTKPPRGAPMSFHQDWTYCDERRFRAAIAWIPLVDVDGDNGAMRVVEGSHRWSDGIRPSNNEARPPTDTHREDFDRLAISIPMRAGEALYFDPAVIHGTPSNTTDAVRPVVGIGLLPEPADLLHFALSDGGLQGYRIPRDRLLIDAVGDPADGLAPYDSWTGPVSASDFDPYLSPDSRAVLAGRRWRDRLRLRQ